jgi:hypothetical protein
MFRNYFDPDLSEHRIITGCISLILLIFILNIFIPPEIIGGVLYILPTLVAMWSRNNKMPLYAAVAVSLSVIIDLFVSPVEGLSPNVFINTGLALGAIWMVAVLGQRLRHYSDEKEKALFEIKRLTGLLPICTLCNKIRKDDGYWEQIESYIHKKSEVEFSHGVCPGCEANLYPEDDHVV